MKHSSQAIGAAEFINVVPINPLISKCQIKVCYVGENENRNHTVITKETALKMAASLPGSPIVGYYQEDKKDFLAHEQELVITEDSVDFKSITVPYGFVDTNAKVWFQWFLDDGLYEREYLVTEGYIWTGRYPEAKRIISQGNNQSMELDENFVKGSWTKDNNGKPQFFIINEAVISALCILGEEREPCFEGAQIASHFELNDEFKETLYEMAQELKKILNEGGNTTMELEEQVTETTIVEETVEIVEEVEVQTETEENVENEEIVEENIESQGQNSENEMSENLESNEGNFSEATEEVEESESEQSAYSLEEIPEYVELQNQYNTLSANYSALEEEVNSLREFKANADRVEKQALIGKFFMLSDEDKADVVNNIDNYSLEEIESRLAVVCFRNKVNFNLEEEETEEKTEETLTYDLSNSDNDFDTAPDWIKAVRETKKTNI